LFSDERVVSDAIRRPALLCWLRYYCGGSGARFAQLKHEPDAPVAVSIERLKEIVAGPDRPVAFERRRAGGRCWRWDPA